MIAIIIFLVVIVILFEIIITIIGYNVIKKIDTISEEPLLENISKLSINKSTSNSDNYIIIKGIILLIINNLLFCIFTTFLSLL